MNIFIDVGGHYGGTLDELSNFSHRFDVVHCLEPQARCFSALQNRFAAQVAAGKLALHNFGLADFDGESVLYGGEDSSIGASLFSDKVDVNAAQTEICKFVKASAFVKSVARRGDFAVMKLNCEGGEALILRDLMADGTIHWLNSVLIDFDIRKIPSQAGEEEKILAEMRALRYENYIVWQELQRIDTWSFSKRRMVSRGIGGYGVPRIKMWLLQIDNIDEVIDIGIMGKAVRHLPKVVWGRLYRAGKIFRKRWLGKGRGKPRSKPKHGV